MNWLAHAFLSGADIEVRMGNLLADLIKGRDRAAMPPMFLEGIRQHQAIDAFTDSHPIVHRSTARIQGERRNIAGILVDIFYDHFLALHWERYSPEPLTDFTAKLYADIRSHPIRLPTEAEVMLERIIAEDRLASYARIDGIDETLRRVSKRLSARIAKDFGMADAVTELITHFDGFESDFAEFFPLLQEHVESVRM